MQLLRRAICLVLAGFLFFAGSVHAHARFDHETECSACILQAASHVASSPCVVPAPLVVEFEVRAVPVTRLASRRHSQSVFETGPPVA